MPLEDVFLTERVMQRYAAWRLGRDPHYRPERDFWGMLLEFSVYAVQLMAYVLLASRVLGFIDRVWCAPTPSITYATLLHLEQQLLNLIMCGLLALPFLCCCCCMWTCMALVLVPSIGGAVNP